MILSFATSCFPSFILFYFLFAACIHSHFQGISPVYQSISCNHGIFGSISEPFERIAG